VPLDVLAQLRVARENDFPKLRGDVILRGAQQIDVFIDARDTSSP
jgi:hypothetical protein